MSKRAHVRTTVAETSKDVIETWSVVKAGLRGLTRSRIPQMAAALSFRTLFALIPVLVLSLVVLQAFVGKDEVTQVLRKTLEFTGISQLVLSDTPDAPGPSEGALPAEGDGAGPGEDPAIAQEDSEPVDAVVGAATEAVDQLVTELDPTRDAGTDLEAGLESPAGAGPDQGIRLDQWIEGTVERILSIRFQTIGALGVLAALIYAAISMLVEIERTFNQIYRAQVGRSWLRRVPQYWTVLTLSVLVLVGTFYAGERFQNAAGDVLGGAIGFIVQASITALLLTFAYAVMPNTKVEVRAAAAGALVAAIAWEVAKTGFRAYIDFAISYRTLYGSIALPLFAMLWMYLTWILILFGLQVSYGIQHIGTWIETVEAEDEPRLNDPASAVPMVVAIAERFEKGQHATLAHLSGATGMPEPVIDELIARLVDDGIINRVESADAAFSLARPPDRILAADVLASAQRISSTQTTGRMEAWIEGVQSARARACGSDSIRDLLGGEEEADSPQAAPDAGATA